MKKFRLEFKTIFLFSLIILFIFAGCQPTPEDDNVINKSDFEENLKSDTQEATDVEEYAKSLPEHVNKEYENNNVKITIDSDVVCEADSDKIPVYKFKKSVLSQEKVDEWVKYFAGNNKLYTWPNLYTKSYYEQAIIDAKKGSEVDGELVVNEEYVKKLEELYEAAPTGNERNYIDSTFNYVDSSQFEIERGKIRLSAAVETGKDDFTILAEKPSEKDNSGFSRFYCQKGFQVITESFINDAIESSNGAYDPDNDLSLVNKCTISEDDAKPAADKVIEALGITDFVLAKSEKAGLLSFNNEYGISSDRPDIPGIQLTYMRNINGVSVDPDIDDTLNADNNNAGNNYAPSITTEKLCIFVSNEGVVENFEYSGILESGSELSDGVTFMDFDELLEHALDQIYCSSAYVGSRKGSKEVNIDSISLVMTYSAAKDDLSSVLLIPAWKFSGTLDYTENDVTSSDPISVTINAVDGSLA